MYIRLLATFHSTISFLKQCCAQALYEEKHITSVKKGRDEYMIYQMRKLRSLQVVGILPRVSGTRQNFSLRIPPIKCNVTSKTVAVFQWVSFLDQALDKKPNTTELVEAFAYDTSRISSAWPHAGSEQDSANFPSAKMVLVTKLSHFIQKDTKMTKGYSGMEKHSDSSHALPSQASSLIVLSIKYSSHHCNTCRGSADDSGSMKPLEVCQQGESQMPSF